MPRYALCPVAVVRNWPHFLHVFPPTVRRYALFGMVGGATDRGLVPWVCAVLVLVLVLVLVPVLWQTSASGLTSLAR